MTNYLVKFEVSKEGKYSHDIFLEFPCNDEGVLRKNLEEQLLPTLKELFKQDYEIKEIKEV